MSQTLSQMIARAVYCAKAPGPRSLLAAETLKSMGFERVQVLGGGLAAWTQAGLAVDGEAQPGRVTA